MLMIYKNKKDIPSDKEYIELINGSELISKYKIHSCFNGDVLNIDKLSAVCRLFSTFSIIQKKCFT